MRVLIVTLFAVALMGCQHFKDTVGCYAETEFGFGYAHQFGDPGGGAISGQLDPAHGQHGASSFRIDRPDQFSEDIVKTDMRLHFAPGACK